MIALALSAGLMLWLSRVADSGSRPAVPRTAALLLLATCFLIGGMFRVWGLDRSLWRDEFGTLWAVEGGLLESVARVTGFHGQTPFYYLFVWPLVHGFGESEVALRLPSLLFGAGAVLLVGLAARLIGGSTAGLIAGAVAWLSTGMTGASVNARPYALGQFCCALVLYGFIGAVRHGDQRFRIAFILGGAGVVLTHYVFAPVLVGIVAGYALFPSVRSHYVPRQFFGDLAWQSALTVVAIPQFLALWGRKAGLVWARDPDYLAVVGTLAPLAVPALLGSVSRQSVRVSALEWTLWLSVAAQIGLLGVAALAGTNLLMPRYIDVVTVPAAILAGVGASQVGVPARLVGLGYMFLLSCLAALAVYRATGQFTVIPHEDWREGVAALTRSVASDPGPVLLQSGFVEQVDGQSDRGAAVLAPLRSPGLAYPDFAVRSLPYAWDSPSAALVREAVAPALLDPSQPVYLLSGGGYTGLFAAWVTDRFKGRVGCQAIGTFVSVELLKCRATPGPT